MPENYFFSDENQEIIREELLDEKAKSLAQSFGGNDRNSLSQTQLRRFFNDLRSLEKRAGDQASFEKIKPLIKMVKSKVAYSQDKIPLSFENFMNDSISAIHTKRDFEAFMLHFEAVVGFSKKYIEKK